MTHERITITGSSAWLSSREITVQGPGLSTQVCPAPLGASLSLPLNSASVQELVIIDLLENMDPGTAYRLLLDAYRVLTADGRLKVVIPYAAAMAETVDDDGLSAFCTFKLSKSDASWQAPQVDTATLTTLRQGKSAARFTIDLVNLVIDQQEKCVFGRQSAWDHDEFSDFLSLVGFQVLADEVLDRGERSVERREPTVVFTAAPVPVGDSPDGPHGKSWTTGQQELAAGVRLGRHGDWESAFGHLRSALESEPALGEKHYRLLYQLHKEGLHALMPPAQKPSKPFSEEGVHVGVLPSDVARAVREELHNVPSTYVRASHTSTGYLSNPNLSPEAEIAINRDNTYLDMKQAGIASLSTLFQALAPHVEACMGTPFRIVNIRSWRTEAHARKVESNGWHRDEPYPPTVLKIIAYLTDASKEAGSTEVVHADGSHSFATGPAGTFLVFRNSELIHRGYPPQSGVREILEITVSPHHQRDLRIICAGNNADFPYSPWAQLDDLAVSTHGEEARI